MRVLPILALSLPLLAVAQELENEEPVAAGDVVESLTEESAQPTSLTEEFPAETQATEMDGAVSESEGAAAGAEVAAAQSSDEESIDWEEPSEKVQPKPKKSQKVAKSDDDDDDDEFEPKTKKKKKSKKSTNGKSGKKSGGFSLGVVAAASYNDFYGTEFGLGELGEDAKGYKIKTEGVDDLTGNYWGVGFNAGLGALYMFNSFIGLHAEVAAAYRRGSGDSKVAVILEWDDSSRQAEKADLEMEISSTQLNIDVPVMLRVMAGSSIYLEAGVAPSFNLMSTMESSISMGKTSEDYTEEDCYETFELGVVGGLGVHNKVGASYLDAGLRLMMGMTGLNDTDDAPKTFQVQFNITYWLL